jgi:hypothetical protein
MKLKTITLAAAFALSSTFAFAQAGGSDSGAEVPNGSGAVVNPNSGAILGTTRNGATINREPGTTTGMSRDEMAPQGMKPGSIDESKPGGQSTARKPPS